MKLKAILCGPLAFLMMLCSLAIPPKPKGIAGITIRVGGSVAPREFKIDLARKNFWAYDGGNRDETARFEGFRFVGRLRKSKVTAFREAAQAYGFTSWEGSYRPACCEDCARGDVLTCADCEDCMCREQDGVAWESTDWYLTIVFANGAVKESHI